MRLKTFQPFFLKELEQAQNFLLAYSPASSQFYTMHAVLG
jgi:hypothetical protein